MKKTVLIALSFLFLSGCAAVRYESPSLAQAPTSNTIVSRYYRFAWGLVPGSPISLEQCGSAGIKRMKVRPNFIDSIITVATAGIIMPTRVKLVCAQPQVQPQPQP